jgi:hypothetical protein
MKELIVKKVDAAISPNNDWTAILYFMQPVEWNNLDTVNWTEYDYRPYVQFRIAYSDTAIFLHYKVMEYSVRALAMDDNGEVWKDSCVEFFVMPENDGIYYNFEFNCIGTCLLAAGTERNGREFAAPDLISQISHRSSLFRERITERKTYGTWNITIGIPYSCFFRHPGYLPAGKTVRANFFKCGDELKYPHFLSWNPIDTEKPEFHRPEFFGTLKFAE